MIDPMDAEVSKSFTLALVIGINAVTGAVVFLFLWFRSQFAKVEKLLAIRDKQRERLWRRVANLTGFARLIQSCGMSGCPFKSVNLDDDPSGDELEDNV